MRAPSAMGTARTLSLCLAAGALVAGGVFGQGLAVALPPAVSHGAKDAAAPPPTDPEVGGTALEGTLASAILAKQRAMEAERAEIAQARIDLAQAEAELEKRIEVLKAAIARQEALKAEILRAKEVVRDTRIDRLVQVAEKMPPANAAAYLDSLDDEVSSRILERMSARKAALVLGALEPAKAATLSRLFMKREVPPDAP